MACSCCYEHDHDEPGNDDTISVEEALGMARLLASPLDPETVALREEAAGLILEEDLLAPDPLPPCPASVKDGYAVVSADGPEIYPISEERAEADAEHDTVQPGAVVYITSGGPVPNGADAVVQVEDTLLVEGPTTSNKIPILTKSAKGQEICPVV